MLASCPPLCENDEKKNCVRIDFTDGCSVSQTYISHCSF